MIITGKCIVELHEGVWLAPWPGDPGRTLVRESAEVFDNWQQAEKHIGFARHYRPYRNAKVIPIEQPGRVAEHAKQNAAASWTLPDFETT